MQVMLCKAHWKRLHAHCHPVISAKNPQANSACERAHQRTGNALVDLKPASPMRWKLVPSAEVLASWWRRAAAQKAALEHLVPEHPVTIGKHGLSPRPRALLPMLGGAAGTQRDRRAIHSADVIRACKHPADAEPVKIRTILEASPSKGNTTSRKHCWSVGPQW